MRRRLIELGKDIIIALLTLAILVLLLLALPVKTLTGTPWLAAAVKPFAGLFGMNEAELTYVETAVPAPSAALPLAISVQNETGRCSAVYDAAALESMYEPLGALLAQALDSAAEPQQTSHAKVCDALRAPSAAFAYSSELTADVLAAWLNASCAESGPARWFILSLDGDTVRLYLVGQTALVCDTALSAETLLAALEGYTPDGSRFAFEAAGGFARVEALSLVPSSLPAVYAAGAENPCDARFTANLAAELGFNPYGDASYTDTQGNTTWSETDCTLRVSAAGEVTLKTASDAPARFAAEDGSLLAQLEAARALLARITDGATGEAQLYLSGYEKTDDGVVCRFDYILGGIVVQQSAGPAAAVRFTGSEITGLRVQLRSYTRTAEKLSLLPAAQAAAIIPAGTVLALSYADTAAQPLQAGWRS